MGINGIKGEGNLISKTAPTGGHDEEPKAVPPLSAEPVATGHVYHT